MAGIKTRWDMRSNPVPYGIESGTTMSKEAEELEILTRQVFNLEEKKINFVNRRATDYKMNTNVYFPKSAERTPNLDFMKRFLCKGGCLTTIITHTLRG